MSGVSSISSSQSENQVPNNKIEKANETSYTDKVHSYWREFLLILREGLRITLSKNDISYIHNRCMAFYCDYANRNNDNISDQIKEETEKYYINKLSPYRSSSLLSGDGKYNNAIAESLFKLMFEVSETPEDTSFFLDTCIFLEKELANDEKQSNINTVLEKLIIKVDCETSIEKKGEIVLGLFLQVYFYCLDFSSNSKEMNNIFKRIEIEKKHELIEGKINESNEIEKAKRKIFMRHQDYFKGINLLKCKICVDAIFKYEKEINKKRLRLMNEKISDIEFLMILYEMKFNIFKLFFDLGVENNNILNEVLSIDRKLNELFENLKQASDHPVPKLEYNTKEKLEDYIKICETRLELYTKYSDKKDDVKINDLENIINNLSSI